MAKAESLSLIQFQKEFGTEENCASYLAHKRWKEGFSCSKCNHSEYYYIKTRQLYECQKCHYQTSVTAGTIMHKTKLPGSELYDQQSEGNGSNHRRRETCTDS